MALLPGLAFAALATFLVSPAQARLAEELGRNEVRIESAPYEIPVGATITGADLPGRLERLGYRRVHRRPEVPGTYFWGHERFWIYQREHELSGRRVEAAPFFLRLRRSDGRILGFGDGRGSADRTWIEPEVLGESLKEARAPRRPLRLGELPEHVWRPVLAAEDHRFFDHVGLDGRGIARALLRNAKAGKVVQGGSTITQQLIKIRDLSPKRTLGRKVSEALRALELESEYDKEEILEAYLDHVYYGHVDGVALYGLGAAARAYFSKHPADLDLGQAATLAAMIQGPNRLSPVKNPKAVEERQRWVLSRMEELEWASEEETQKARSGGLPRLRRQDVAPSLDRRLRGWLQEVARDEAPRRLAKGRGVRLETTLDPVLQARAEALLGEHLRDLRRRHRQLRSASLSAALVTLDADTGAILAAVGGDPRDSQDAFNRVKNAKRQPGSAVKPFVLLEAFDDCGREAPLYPARRVLDRAVRIPVPDGVWEPQNDDGRFRGPVTLREALVSSLNVPFVRTARWCGFEATAKRMRDLGLEMPKKAPPSLVLGAVEASPLEMAQAYATFATLGEAVDATLVQRVARPSGWGLFSWRGGVRRPDFDRVARSASAYLVRNLMEDAVARGTGREAALEGAVAWGKTGTSSNRRDAWFVGGAGRLVTAVWVGNDDGTPLGLTGATAALPLWQALMQEAIGAYPPTPQEVPREIVEHWVQPETELLYGRQRKDAVREIFRRGTEPPRRRLLRVDEPVEILR